MFSLSGKNALITGAAGGIGLAVAKRFVAAGARVVITDISDAKARAEEIGAEFLPLDVGDEQQVTAVLGEATQKFGQLDILVNNAGIGDVGQTIEETSQDVLERLTRINHWGVLYGLKHGPAYMRDHGSIINTSSLAGRMNLIGSAAYSAGKAAVLSMTEMAALELGKRGIRVNAICPGYVSTAMGSGEEGEQLMQAFSALGRVATTDDLIGIFHFLAADESRFMTGQALIADGGWSCGPSAQLLNRVIGRPRVS
jgi:NAD(P)-dependent dehydrogenase (short-subunit alcohol dehydrogenase family)